MRTIAAMLTLGLAVASFIGCNTRNRPQRPASLHSSVQLVEGDYLSTDYIHALKETRSPRTAGSSGGMELVTVERDGEKFVLLPIINFHEGDTGFAINQDGSVASVAPREPKVSKVTVAVLDDHTIRFGYDDFKPATYEYVKNATAFVAKAVLVGKYEDEQGRRYEFQEDGWAAFPDRRFEFEIGLDHVLDGFDYFMDAGKDKKHLPWATWAFKWSGNTLQVFRTKDEGGIDKLADSNPLLVLHPVR